MRKHRLYGFGLALLTVVGAQAILQRRAAPRMRPLPPTRPALVTHRSRDHQFRSSLVADDAGSNSPGWNQITQASKRCLIGGRGGTGRRRPHDSPADRTRLTGPVPKAASADRDIPG